MLSCSEVGCAFSDVVASFFKGDHGYGLVVTIIFFEADLVISDFVWEECFIYIDDCFSSFDFFNVYFGIEGVLIVDGEAVHRDLGGVHYEDRLHKAMENESCTVSVDFDVMEIDEREANRMHFRLIVVRNMVAHIKCTFGVKMVCPCWDVDGATWVPTCFADQFAERRALVFLCIGLDSKILAAK